jgi:cytochrome c oxidase cbb3-type subunit 3
MASPKDQLLAHDADGINEYDNPMPGWLTGLLFGTVGFAILYIGFYALAFGPASMRAEYRGQEVAERDRVQAYFDAHPLSPPSADVLLAGAGDPAVLEPARARFAKTCASCHGEAAQGLIGPNLTDDRWLHGGQVVQIFNTIAKGVPAKGMPPWGRALPPEELAALVSYVRSLQGSTPPNPKPPEGEPVTPEPLPVKP